MPLAHDRSQTLSGAEILGIYGQNGSGKTAVVDSLYFLQQIMIGQEMDQDICSYIDVDAEHAEMIAEFKIFGSNIMFEVGYHLFLKRREKRL